MKHEFLNIVNNGKLNWEAISSLATLAAVVVALLPTFAEQRRRRRVAQNLRIRILTCLLVIKAAVENYVRASELGTAIFILNDAQTDAIRTLEKMLPEMIILQDEEYGWLVTAIADIKMMEVQPKVFTKRDLSSFQELMDYLERKLK